MKLSEIVARAIGPRPLTAVSRRSIVDGIERCYREAGVPWHGRVVWTPSPSATAVAAALRTDASPKPLTLLERIRRYRNPPTGTAGRPDRTWDRIEARIRWAWRAAPFPRGEPGVVLDEGADPLARIRNVLTARYRDDGVPRDRFDGAFDERLILAHRIAAMGEVGAPADEPSGPAAPVRRGGTRARRRPGSGGGVAVRLSGPGLPTAQTTDLTEEPMHTYATALALVGTGVPAHLAADAEVPILTGPQAQGDLMVFRRSAPSTVEWRPLPADGLRLVDGEATGNTHWLHAGFDSSGVRWAESTAGPPRLGFLRVPPGQTALLIHTDEHGANGIGPGTYVVHRKREQVQLPATTAAPAPVTVRLVAD